MADALDPGSATLDAYRECGEGRTRDNAPFKEGAMFRKRKLLKKVIMHFDNYEGSIHSEEIIIPNGWKFQQEFAEKAKLIDEMGQVRKIYDPRAGYAVTTEYFYD